MQLILASVIGSPSSSSSARHQTGTLSVKRKWKQILNDFVRGVFREKPGSYQTAWRGVWGGAGGNFSISILLHFVSPPLVCVTVLKSRECFTHFKNPSSKSSLTCLQTLLENWRMSTHAAGGCRRGGAHWAGRGAGKTKRGPLAAAVSTLHPSPHHGAAFCSVQCTAD